MTSRRLTSDGQLMLSEETVEYLFSGDSSPTTVSRVFNKIGREGSFPDEMTNKLSVSYSEEERTVLYKQGYIGGEKRPIKIIKDDKTFSSKYWLAEQLGLNPSYLSKQINVLKANPRPEKTEPKNLDIQLNFVKSYSRTFDGQEYKFYRLNYDGMASAVNQITESYLFDLTATEREAIRRSIEAFNRYECSSRHNLYERKEETVSLNILYDYVDATQGFTHLADEELNTAFMNVLERYGSELAKTDSDRYK